MKINGMIIVASILMLFLVLQLPFKAKLYGDWTFHTEAKILASWVIGQVSLEEVELTKAPGPVMFYALPYILAGVGKSDTFYWKSAFTWNTFWLAFSLMLVQKTAKMIFSSGRVGIMTIVMAFLLPLHLYYGIGILAETMAFVGFALFAYGTSFVFMDTKRSASSNISIVAGLLFMVTARPNSLLILAFLPVIILWLWRDADFNLRNNLRKFFMSYVAVCILVTFILGIIRFLPGNQLQPSQESYFTYVAHHGRYQFRTETWDWRFWDSDARSDSKDYQLSLASSKALHEEMSASGQSMNETYTKWLLLDIVHHPLTLIKQFCVRLMYGHFLQISSVKPDQFSLGQLKGKWAFYALQVGINILNLLILVAAYIGFVQTAKKRRFVLLLLMPWLALAIFHGFIYMEQRYMYPVRPFFLIFAAPILLKWIHLTFNRKQYFISQNATAE